MLTEGNWLEPQVEQPKQGQSQLPVGLRGAVEQAAKQVSELVNERGDTSDGSTD
jgi:hypothetical protein